MSEPQQFNPAAHLSTVGNYQYLEVKWRLVWFRTEHPTGIIETELVEHKVSTQQPNMSYAVCKATVQTAEGAGATGYGSESRGDFRDYMEKAETKALGRALAALGFGTQFTNDFDGGRLVDNPAPRRQAMQSPQPSSGHNGYYPNGSGAETGELATPKQVSFARGLIKQAGLSDNWLAAILHDDYHGTSDLVQLTKREISQLIAGLKSGRFDPTPPGQADEGIEPSSATSDTPEPDDPYGELPW